jgi:hypothetical protein
MSLNIERVSGIFSVPLNIAIRADNIQKRTNNDLMYGIVSYVNKIYRSSSDEGKVLSFIKDKIKFRFYKDSSTINGD